MTDQTNGDDADLMALTASEQQKVGELRALLDDLIVSDAMARDHSDDATLWRFLVARDSNLEKAATMFRGSMEWRKTAKIDELWERKRIKKERTTGDDCFYAGVSGITLAGGALMVERLGRVDASGLAKNRRVFEELKECYMIFLERAFRQVRSTKNKTQAVVVVDASGLSKSTLYNISIIKEIAAIGPPNYPEVTCGVYIVNTPWIFAAAWKILRPLLPKDTAAKITVCGSDFLDVLREKVSDDHIPAFLGGGCTLVDDDHDDFEALLQPCPPPEPH